MDVSNNEEMDEQTEPEFECQRVALRPKSFLHDEMNEFNKIFAELAKPKRYLSLKSCQSVEQAISAEGASSADLNVVHAAKMPNSIPCCCCSTVENEHCSSYLQTAEFMNTISSQNKCHSTRFEYDVNQEDDNDSGYQSGNNTLVASLSQLRVPGNHRDQPTHNLESCVAKENSVEMPSCIDQGFIRVKVNLNQPINMALKTVADNGCCKQTDAESFHLPNETVVVIHITSKMTTSEVIQTLLDKYMITDSCNKFALYEKTSSNSSNSVYGQQYDNSFRRLGNDEHPLILWLQWTEDINSHQFVLQNNFTSEIAWDAFSLPELEAFIHILEREEAAYVKKITQNFQSLKAAAVQRLKQMGTT